MKIVLKKSCRHSAFGPIPDSPNTNLQITFGRKLVIENKQ